MKNKTKETDFRVLVFPLFIFFPSLVGAWQVESVFGVTIDSANGATMGNYIGVILGFIYSISAVLIVIRIIGAGYQYIQSNGNPQKIERAKHMLQHAFEGLAIIFLAVLFAQFVGSDLLTKYIY